MARQYNPLVKFGFDYTSEGTVISPAAVYIPSAIDERLFYLTGSQEMDFNNEIIDFDFNNIIAEISQN